MLIRQPAIVSYRVLCFQRGHAQTAGGVFACEDWTLSVLFLEKTPECWLRTVVGGAWGVGFVAGDVEDCALWRVVR